MSVGLLSSFSHFTIWVSQIWQTHYHYFKPVIVGAHNPRESIILQAQTLGQNETKESQIRF